MLAPDFWKLATRTSTRISIFAMFAVIGGSATFPSDGLAQTYTVDGKPLFVTLIGASGEDGDDPAIGSKTNAKAGNVGGSVTATVSGGPITEGPAGPVSVIVTGGNGGNAYTGAYSFTSPENGAAGGGGGTIDLTIEANLVGDTGGSGTVESILDLVSAATSAGAVNLIADGGVGGDGNPSGGGTGTAGTGGSGGKITAKLSGSISSSRTNGAGVVARANGGDGGTANGTNRNTGTNGGAGGAGGNVTVTGTGISITTTGTNSPGILATANGGDGTDGSPNQAGFTSKPNAGGDGGTGGAVKVTLDAGTTVTTSTHSSQGVLAEANGGAGGSSGAVDISLDVRSGQAGGSGNAGTAEVTSAAKVTTSGDAAHGIVAQSQGGAGGDGTGQIGLIVSDGTPGAGGGNGGTATVTHDAKGSITTSGQGAYGIIAQSLGGVGGGGGKASSAAVSLGGDGGAAGSGGKATVTNAGSVTTSGQGSPGITALSVGGGGGILLGETVQSSAPPQGGGDGGTSYSILGPFSMGGTGGGGGDGGDVSVSNTGSVTTKAANSHAIQAQSIGGGGGQGGGAYDFGLFASVTIGGDGGNGGDGGAVSINPDVTSKPASHSGKILTERASSYGIYASSVGGGGGDGGSTLGVALGLPMELTAGAAYSVQVGLGGTGGDGGDGGTVNVNNISKITVKDVNSYGIFAQSVGGGGGTGGSSTGVSLSLGAPSSIPSGSVAVDIGGKGGGGGKGGDVTVNNYASVDATGDMSGALLAQSVGGGGGAGGDATGYSAAINGFNSGSATVTVGGKGGDGGSGGTVTVKNEASLSTDGQFADALHAQSIGGGGGTGGNGASYAVPGVIPTGKNFTASVSIGGRGGKGGDGAAVSVTNAGEIKTDGQGSRGIFAQSVGGGGGNGGGAQSIGISTTEAANVGVGGTGGSGGSGGSVDVTNEKAGTITTQQDGGSGIVAQSIGGGGGTGGAASASQAFATGSAAANTLKALSSKLKDLASKVGGETSKYSASQSVNVGGKGGVAGDGRDVTVTNNGTITTWGDKAEGIIAQSIGGGGGVGGAATGAGAALVNIDVNVGGAGGSAGDGGAVTVTNSGSVTTNSAFSMGVFAQSVGGGGGTGGSALDKSSAVANTSFQFGGGTGTSGGGGSVDVTNTGPVTTKGAHSHGVVAQSVGGGGGTIAVNFQDFQYLTQQTTGQTDGNPGVSDDAQIYTTPGSPDGGAAGASGGSLGLSFNFATKGGNSGHGGKVSITAGSTIKTSGDDAYGVFAQSVGGGGGLGGANSGPVGIANVQIGADGGAGGNGGEVKVTLKEGLSIKTTGVGAAGIVAQSIGGGGGQAGGVTGSWGLNFGNGRDNVGGNGGNGGKITLRTEEGAKASITTSNIGAHGIFAQSVGGGGGAVGTYNGMITLHGSEAHNGAPGAGGDIDIDYTGAISATGKNSVGIFAEATGGTETVDGDIPFTASPTISVTTNGTIVGGTGNRGAGIALIGGGQNTVTIAGGSVSAGTGGFAIAALQSADGTSQVSVINNGTIIGDVDLGRSVKNSFQNNGTFYPGPNVIINNSTGDAYWYPISSELLVNGTPSDDLGTYTKGSDTFTDAGLTNVGGVGTIAASRFDVSNYVLTKAGVLQADVDFNGSQADALTVTGNAELNGAVAPNLTTLPATGSLGPVTVFTAQDTISGAPTARDTLAAQYSSAVSADRRTVTVSFDGLQFNNSAVQSQAAKNIASNFQSAWEGGTVGQLSAELIQLANIPIGQEAAYNDALEGTSGEGSAAAPSSAPIGAQRFANALHSCPVFVGDSAFLMEESCVWSRVVGGRQTEYNSAGVNGYDIDWSAFQMGGQKALENDWFLGGALSLGQSNLDSNDGTFSSDANDYAVGVVVKKRIDQAWEIAVSGNYTFATSDSSRTVASQLARMPNGLFPVATASSDSHTLAGRMRFAYYADIGRFYAKPMIDLDAAYVHVPAYNETGAGRWNLHYDAESDYQAAISPSLEVGSRIDVGLGTMRAYARAGFTYWNDRDWEQGVRFEGTAAGDQGHTNIFDGSEFYGKGALGAEIVSDKGLEMRVEYEVQGNNDFLNQNIAGRLSYRF